MQTQLGIENELRFRTSQLINSTMLSILSKPEIKNEDELKGWLKALKWVLQIEN